MYQSVCLISEERNECVIATEVSVGGCSSVPLGDGNVAAEAPPKVGV